MASNSTDSFESPWRLTAQIHLDPHGVCGSSADPAGISRARPAARGGERSEVGLVRSQTKGKKVGRKSTEAGGQTTRCS